MPGPDNWVGSRTIFEYVVAVDYADTLIALEAFNSDTRYQLNVTRSEMPISESASAGKYNSTDFLWFQIDLTDELANGESEVSL